MVCGRWPWWPLAVLGTLACQVGKDELKVTPVELVSGDFQSLAWGGAQVERFHVVAQRGTSDEAVIWSPDHGATCSLGSVAWYTTTQPLRLGGLAVGSLGRGLVPFVETLDDAGRGTLRFAGIDCKPLELEIPDVKRSELWSIEDSELTKPTFAVRTSDKRLIFADPWLGTQREIAHDVSGIAQLSDQLWIVEGGQAVLRDLTGVEMARTGKAVRELVVLNGVGDIAYVDAGGLSVWRSSGAVTHLANDACTPRVLDGFPQGTLAYFSACDQRQLVLENGKHVAKVVAPAVVDFAAANGWLCYTVRTDSSTQLWIADTDGKATRVAESPAFDLDRVWNRGAGKLLVSMTQGDNTLSLWDIDTAHKSAVQLASDLASIRVGTDAFVTIDSNQGLSLQRLSDLKVERVSKGVLASTVRFMFDESLPALGYVADADPDTGLGRFELHFISGAAQDPPPLANDVREIHEVWWPESGIVYAIGAGKSQGLWFAHVDVPCDKTSDTPWACGF
jgi:hypothetical protein